MIGTPTIVASGPKRFRFRLTVDPPWTAQTRVVGDGSWSVVISQKVYPGDGSPPGTARSLSWDAWHNVAPDQGERAPNFVDHLDLVALAGWDWQVRHTHHSDPAKHGDHWDELRVRLTVAPGAAPGSGSFGLDFTLIHGTVTDIFRSWMEEQGCLFPFFGALRDWWVSRNAKADRRVVAGPPSREPDVPDES